MKKGAAILLLSFAFGLCVVIGIFIGRNHRDEYQQLPQDSISRTIPVQETTIDTNLDINKATKAQLMELPGIGEELAERIIRYRTANGPFESTDELMNVEGIGEKKLLALESYIKVGG